jgi:hypothetical protein
MISNSLHVAMASDFSVPWLFSQIEQLVICITVQFHALIQLGVSPSSLDTGAQNGVLVGLDKAITIKKYGLAKV